MTVNHSTLNYCARLVWHALDERLVGHSDSRSYTRHPLWLLRPSRQQRMVRAVTVMGATRGVVALEITCSSIVGRLHRAGVDVGTEAEGILLRPCYDVPMGLQV